MASDETHPDIHHVSDRFLKICLIHKCICLDMTHEEKRSHVLIFPEEVYIRFAVNDIVNDSDPEQTKDIF